MEDFEMDVTGKIRDSEAAAEGGNILQQPCTWRPRAPGQRCRLGCHLCSFSPLCVYRIFWQAKGLYNWAERGQVSDDSHKQVSSAKRHDYKFAIIGRRHP